MCVSTPSVTQPKVEAPVKAVEMDASENSIVSRENELQRRRRALSRLQTMQGGSMQGNEAGTGKTKLGV